MNQATRMYDFSELDFWSLTRQQRLEHYRRLRDSEPFSWHGSDTSGFWAAARYDDVRTISREAELFCSSKGITQTDANLKALAEQAGVGFEDALSAMSSMAMMDDPEHARLRGLIRKAFMSRQIKRIEDQILTDAKEIVDSIESGETGDFVERISRRLPLITISRMLGLSDDEEERARFVEQVDAAFRFADPEFCGDRDPMQVFLEALGGFVGFAAEKCAQARANPGGDGLICSLVEVEEGGEKLTDEEIINFFLLLAAAGNDTTRNTTSWTMRALTQFRDQRALLIEDPSRYSTGVEEFIRWATPVTNFLRTATGEAQVGDHVFHAGEKVMMLYESANRDERAFDDPDRFDVSRYPNPNVSFGGGGTHFCLGATLARTQLRALFTELLRQFPDMEVEEPESLVSNIMAAPKRMAMDAGRRAV